MRDGWLQNRSRKKRLTVLAIVVGLPILYYGLTEIQIRRSVSYFTQKPHRLTLWQFFTATGEQDFLRFMGKRSLPAIHKALDNPDLLLSDRITLVGILSSMGDHSRFEELVKALNDPSIQLVKRAVYTMEKYPSQCFLYRNEIFEAGKQRKMPNNYFILLWWMGQNLLSPEEEVTLNDILPDLLDKEMLTEEEVLYLKEVFNGKYKQIETMQPSR